MILLESKERWHCKVRRQVISHWKKKITEHLYSSLLHFLCPNIRYNHKYFPFDSSPVLYFIHNETIHKLCLQLFLPVNRWGNTVQVYIPIQILKTFNMEYISTPVLTYDTTKNTCNKINFEKYSLDMKVRVTDNFAITVPDTVCRRTMS